MPTNIEKILNKIGVTLNGTNPWDIQVHDKRFINRIMRDQSIGAGESYMDGWWDCEQLDELFFRICRNHLTDQFYAPWKISLAQFANLLFNQQNRDKAQEAISAHFSLGNRLYECMLGKSMSYTCGYWKTAKTLDEAQFAKFDLICKKLYLQPGEKVLDIGCGWGSLSMHMAQHYGVEVIATDANIQSISYAKQNCTGLPVTIYQGDYRDINIYNSQKIKFDKLVCVGVLEHVGYKNYATLLDLARLQLKPEGIFLLHSIGGNVSKNYCDPWIDKYIFRHGQLPSLKQLGEAFEHRFVVEDLHNFGVYYDKTLLAWHHNLNAHWSELKSNYNERFRRMMNYYLLSCAGAFRARDMQLWQFVLTPNGLLGGYEGVRS